MLPVHCHGLVYTPRLLAVMLLLARHRRLTQSGQPQTAADAVSGVDRDQGAQGAGAVCEGRARRRSPGLLMDKSELKGRR